MRAFHNGFSHGGYKVYTINSNCRVYVQPHGQHGHGKEISLNLVALLLEFYEIKFSLEQELPQTFPHSQFSDGHYHILVGIDVHVSTYIAGIPRALRRWLPSLHG